MSKRKREGDEGESRIKERKQCKNETDEERDARLALQRKRMIRLREILAEIRENNWASHSASRI